MPILLNLFIGFFLLFWVSGCATLNESECRSADWYMIGLSDGSKGRLLSYIGKHRQACAKHEITPDMVAYRHGHSEGIKKYCTESNGYRVGKSGTVYNGVCPKNLTDDFMAGYRIGKKHHTFSQAIKQADSAISSSERKIKELKEKIQKKEEKLVSAETTAKERRQLLEKVKEHRQRIEDLELKISNSTKQKTINEYRLEKLKRRHDLQ